MSQATHDATAARAAALAAPAAGDDADLIRLCDRLIALEAKHDDISLTVEDEDEDEAERQAGLLTPEYNEICQDRRNHCPDFGQWFGDLHPELRCHHSLVLGQSATVTKVVPADGAVLANVQQNRSLRARDVVCRRWRSSGDAGRSRSSRQDMWTECKPRRMLQAVIDAARSQED